MNDENRMLDANVVQLDRAKSTHGYRFQTAAEMSAMPVKKDWLIKGVFARGESSAWVAPPGGMKSALLAEASVCVAYGHDWHGYRNKGAMGVVYFALERADLVRRRILAHVLRMRLSPPPIVIVGDMVDPRNAKRIIATIREAEDALGLPIGLSIFDTFAKLIAAASGNENDAKDQGMVFANLQRVKNATGVHLAIIGHTGKDVTRGMRGSNAALGDVDLMVEISGEAVRTATVTKANDAPEGPLFSFMSEVHEFGTDEDGDPITVNFVSGAEITAQTPKSSGRKLNEKQSAFYRLLYDAGDQGLTLAEWNSQGREIGLSKTTVFSIRKALEDRGVARAYGDRWKVNHSG
jgi:AAA domain-containing protein